jgi:DNA-binding CsgD family transcriptional regulator
MTIRTRADRTAVGVYLTVTGTLPESELASLRRLLESATKGTDLVVSEGESGGVPSWDLTPRQRDIVRVVAANEGITNRQIMAELGMTIGAVKTQMSAIHKTGAVERWQDDVGYSHYRVTPRGLALVEG